MVQSKAATASVCDVSNKVVQKVAEAKNVDPLEVTPPLYEVIDSDALDQIFRNAPPGSRTGARVSFSYNECEVTVYNDGSVSINE